MLLNLTHSLENICFFQSGHSVGQSSVKFFIAQFVEFICGLRRLSPWFWSFVIVYFVANFVGFCNVGKLIDREGLNELGQVWTYVVFSHWNGVLKLREILVGFLELRDRELEFGGKHQAADCHHLETLLLGYNLFRALAVWETEWLWVKSEWEKKFMFPIRICSLLPWRLIFLTHRWFDFACTKLHLLGPAARVRRIALCVQEGCFKIGLGFPVRINLDLICEPPIAPSRYNLACCQRLFRQDAMLTASTG